MSLLLVLLLLLGPGLMVVALFAKSLAVRILAIVIGGLLLICLGYVFGSIPGWYAQDHRDAENHYHQQIIRELDRMLAEGNTEAARNLTSRYLRETKGSSFMRIPLHDIVGSLEKAGTEQGGQGNSVPSDNHTSR